MSDCPMCGAALATPLGCEQCGPLPVTDPPPGPFATFGLEPGFDVDAAALRKQLVRLSRLLHPDFYSTRGDELRERAERNTAALNAAFETLGDDYRRADYLLHSLGGPDQDAERQMPQAFLLEVLDWNEALEEARDAELGSPERAALDALAEELPERRAEAMAEIGRALSPLPAPGSEPLTMVRQLLNAVRYLDRTLQTIEALRLEHAKRP